MSQHSTATLIRPLVGTLSCRERWYAVRTRDSPHSAVRWQAKPVDVWLKVDTGSKTFKLVERGNTCPSAKPLAKFIHDRGARNWLP